MAVRIINKGGLIAVLSLVFLLAGASDSTANNHQGLVFLPIITEAESSPPPPPPKVGAAGVFHQVDCEQFGLSIGQNWLTRRAYIPDCAEFVPNVSCTIRRYGDYRNGRLQLQEARKYLPPDYSGNLLFLNEPLYRGQCNISPYNAALLYWQTVEQYPNACISSPNWSHSTIIKYRVEADKYVQAIVDNAPDDVTFDGFCFWAVHNYHAEDPSIVYESLTEFMEAWGDGDKPIWVTEYGATKPNQVEGMIRATLCHPQIVTAWWWSPYSDDPTALRNKDGITPVGIAYIETISDYEAGVLCDGS